jgi:DNA-directed RNA polymerase III subunit RPC11
MRFCPWDGSLLIVDNAGTDGHFRFRCVACPYVDRIRPDRPVQVRERKAAKKADDVLGGEEAWKDVSTTEASCPKCGNKRAYYIEFQTRSADEPATIFMKCTACSQQVRNARRRERSLQPCWQSKARGDTRGAD